MKNTYYRVGLAVLVIVVVFSIMGGVAVAASPPGDNLVGMVSYIKDKVDSIYNGLTDGTHGLAAIKTAINGLPGASFFNSQFSNTNNKIDSVSANLTDSYSGLWAIRDEINALQTKLDYISANISSLGSVNMSNVPRMVSYADWVDLIEGDPIVFFTSEQYPEGAHFSVTMWVSGVDGVNENVEVDWYLPASYDLDNFGNGGHHFEVDANRIEFVWGHSHDEISVHYIVIVTYPQD
jgi:hypothetical protein